MQFYPMPQGAVHVAVWVDDCLCVGAKANIMNAITDIEKHFKVKIEVSIVDYLSCEIVVDEAHGT